MEAKTKDFSKLSSLRLEDIIYIPTENELREIAEILTDRNEEMIKSYREKIDFLDGKNLTHFGIWEMNNAKENLARCIEKRERLNTILNK